ncbi:MAG: sensor histidine kinase/response regulator hybrid protein [Rickettsiaceae bacterium]|jgi:signal transduction histidine kinase|nr:sensor histidine kinase/response regulator hybrid protein [Rickettsiaceae bacterium]
MKNENLEKAKSFLTEDDKCFLLKRSVSESADPCFLCQSDPENSNLLTIIDCNEKFLTCFSVSSVEAIGSNFDFFLQKSGISYEMGGYFEYINLIRLVQNLLPSQVTISIPNNIQGSIDQYVVNTVPVRYNTEKTYCIFTFVKVLSAKNFKEETNPISSHVIQHLERAVRNEKLLRNVTDSISTGSDLKEVSQSVAKMICEYLKVDRCIIYSAAPESGFLVEHNMEGVAKISDSGDVLDLDSPIRRYIDFHNQIFLDATSINKNAPVMVFEDIKDIEKYDAIEDICLRFGISSQIVIVMTFGNMVIGSFYVQQSSKRNWFLEESELINIIANQMSVAIDRFNYTHKLLISNQELFEKGRQLAKSLKQEKRIRELQSEFVTLVSHEFKTPLQIIDGARELISRKMKAINISDEGLNKLLGRIQNAVSRMSNLIQSNLDLSRIEIEEGEIKVNKQDFDIKHLITDIVEKILNLAQDRHVKIEVNIDNLPEQYSGDQKLLDHSFSNIISNAIKYSKPNSSVKISGEEEGDNIVIKVADSGIGIPKNDLEKIGNKFFRAKNTVSVAGTGIGLYLTKHFIELHNGTLLMESELNVGTTVTVHLPK